MSNPKFRFWLILTILWMGVIYVMSAMSAEISTAQSTSVWEVLHTIWPDLTHEMVRKIAHGLEYLVLGGFSLGMFFNTKSFKVAKPMLFSLLVALGDETLQLHVAGRSSEVMDVWIDFGGAVVGILLFWAILTVRKNQKK
ncbi:MAG: VanZ family protein [Oscillospiraceae bacterium]|nr:VanZ family protein [Oscillospiraceae bacterium]